MNIYIYIYIYLYHTCDPQVFVKIALVLCMRIEQAGCIPVYVLLTAPFSCHREKLRCKYLQ